MNLSPLAQQAKKHQHSGWQWLFLHPEQMIEICRERERIGKLVERARLELADLHLEALRKTLAEMQELIE